MGSVSVTEDGKHEAVFRIRNIQHIIQYVLPIFDAFPLLTSKQFNYLKFREAILIIANGDLTKQEKHDIISAIKAKKMPENYVSSAWVNITDFTKVEVMKVITKFWIVGFTEAEGSFYLTIKGFKRLVHVFEITQKLDIIVLKAIALILNLRVARKKTYNCVIGISNDSLITIVNYFFNTIKGMKSVEYRI